MSSSGVPFGGAKPIDYLGSVVVLEVGMEELVWFSFLEKVFHDANGLLGMAIGLQIIRQGLIVLNVLFIFELGFAV